MILYLFSRIRGQIEHEHRQKRDAHARDDEIHGVEEGLAPHCDVECDVQVRLVTACVVFLVSAAMRKLC